MGLNDYEDLKLIQNNNINHFNYCDVEFIDIVVILENSNFIVSGRHHLNVFSLLAKKPFIPFESNTWKIKGLCELCKVNIGTEIHYLEYQKNANKNDYLEEGFHKNHVANLVNICEECHNNIHKNDSKKIIVRKKIVKKTKTDNGYEII